MKSIQMQLFVIMIGLAIIPMTVVGLSTVAIADHSLQDLTLNLMDNHAKDILRRSEDRLSYLKQGLIEFSTNLNTIRVAKDYKNDLAVQRRFFTDVYTFLISKPEVTRILIIRNDNTIFGYNFSPFTNPGLTYRDDIFTPEACALFDTFTDEFVSPSFRLYNSPHTNEATSLIICYRIRDPETYQPIAVMVAHINFSESKELFDNITLWQEEEIVLLRNDGTVLASTHKAVIGEKRQVFEANASMREKNQSGQEKFTYSVTQGQHGIEIQVKVPSRVLQEMSRRQFVLIATILLFTAGLLVISFWLTKRKFFGKLGNLSRTLRAKEKSPLQPIEGEWGHDEIGELVDNYNIVTSNARKQFHLERERLERIKELELAAMQNQIKPHFLYNTLDVGVWYAKEIKAEKIQNLLINLSRYYRISLSSGADLIPIKNELQHAIIYMEMEQLRTSNPFQMIIDVPDELQDYYINKITLQPIVENCIKHGLKSKTDQDSLIVISGKITDHNIELIVDDNGVGMNAEEVAKILTPTDDDPNNRGFAVVNVHKRLNLRYGKEYGLHYQSHPGVGTSVRIMFPKIIDPKGTYESTDSH